MKWFLLVGVLEIGGMKTYAQNLVPNGSFEDTVHCPNGPSEIYYSLGWSSYSYSPDYFNACANGVNYGVGGVPDNEWGTQESYDGNAYSALETFTIAGPNIREFMGRELSQPLVVGTKYFVSAFVSRADNLNLKCATNNLGFRFSTIAYSFSNPAPVDNFSHVHCDTIITDQTNWVHIGGSFIADSVYDYIIIGNFYDDGHTDTFDCVLDGVYYIDNVCVSTDSLLCLGNPLGIEESNFVGKLDVSPNPATTSIQLHLPSNHSTTLTIFTLFGEKVNQQTITGSDITIDVSELPAGMYVVRAGEWSGKFIKE